MTQLVGSWRFLLTFTAWVAGAALIPGFCFGSFLSVASFSQAWPWDALLLLIPFAIIGAILGLVGWKLSRRVVHTAIVSMAALAISTISTVLLMSVFNIARVPGDALIPAVGLWVILSIALAVLTLVFVVSRNTA
jgi:hypothetical protein